jgi:Ca-activated chloride channel family protein
MRKKAWALVFGISFLILCFWGSKFTSLKSIFCKIIAETKLAEKAAEKRNLERVNKTMAGAIEMYSLDFNVDVSQVDLNLMSALQSNGYIQNAPDGIASIQIGPKGEINYLGTDGNVVGTFAAERWFSGPPLKTERMAPPTIAQLGDITPFFATSVKRTSTFCVDVDTASYSVSVKHIENGQYPPADSVRVEEFMNAFQQGYAPVVKGDFALYSDGAPSTYGGGLHMLRLGLKAREVLKAQRDRPLIVTLIVDSSGSMSSGDRLEMLKRTIPGVIKRLGPEDRVSIVAYSKTARTVLESCSVANEQRIRSALDSISAGGGTNIEAGLQKGYEIAARQNSGNVRSLAILFSDGVSNNGELDADKLMEGISKHAKEGIVLGTIGVGMGEYNDKFLERLACRGNGIYSYMNEGETAAEEFARSISVGSAIVASNVRMEVEFDPLFVKGFRLIGYDNRDKGKMNLDNAKEEAGAVFAGTEVAVLYEIELTEKAEDSAERVHMVLGNATLHYVSTDGCSKKVTMEISRSSIVDSIEKAPFHFKVAAVVAEFAEIVRESPFARNRKLPLLLERIKELSAARPGDSQTANFSALVGQALKLKVESEKSQQIYLKNGLTGRIALR